MDRRKFLASIGRGTILAGLASVTGVLIHKRAKVTEPCNFDFICNNCNELKSCKQPEAIIFKRNKLASRRFSQAGNKQKTA